MPRYRTPLRYPGGKQRLAPFIAEILEHNNAVGWNYVEPTQGAPASRSNCCSIERSGTSI